MIGFRRLAGTYFKPFLFCRVIALAYFKNIPIFALPSMIF
jgi:hypothetical protein